MLAELNTEAVKRTGMQTVQKASYDKLGPQIKPFDLVNDFGFEIFFDGHGVLGFHQTSAVSKIN